MLPSLSSTRLSRSLHKHLTKTDYMGKCRTAPRLKPSTFADRLQGGDLSPLCLQAGLPHFFSPRTGSAARHGDCSLWVGACRRSQSAVCRLTAMMTLPAPWADARQPVPRIRKKPIESQRLSGQRSWCSASCPDSGADLHVKFRHCRPSPISNTAISEIG